MSLLKTLSAKLKRPAPGRFNLLKRGYPLWGLCGFILAFILGFTLFFPLDPIARQVEQLVEKRAHLTLEISQPGWGFPPGISADQLSLTGAALQGERLQLDQLSISPLWSSLLSTNPGVSITGNLFSGDLDAAVRKQGELDLKLSGARLEEQKLSPQLSILLSGTNGNLDFSGVLPIAGANQSQVELNLDQIVLTGMSALGSAKDNLSAGKLQVVVDIKGTTVSIKSLELSGGDLALSGSGTIILGSRPKLSRLNLSLLLKPGPQLDPQLRDLLGLLAKPERDGSIKFRLLGSLAAPQLR